MEMAPWTLGDETGTTINGGESRSLGKSAPSTEGVHLGI